ncbi:MAG: vWA domain-containing protein [Actinomycetota bacterium]
MAGDDDGSTPSTEATETDRTSAATDGGSDVPSAGISVELTTTTTASTTSDATNSRTVSTSTIETKPDEYDARNDRPQPTTTTEKAEPSSTNQDERVVGADGNGGTTKPDEYSDAAKPPSDTSDPLPAIVCAEVDLGAVRLTGLGSIERNTSDPVAIDLPDGQYQLVLTSTDPNHRIPTQPSQPDERWVLEGLDADGTVVFTSATTRDLPDALHEIIVDVGTITATGVVSVRARHASVGTEGNSIIPTTARFAPLDDTCPDPDPDGPGPEEPPMDVPDISDELRDALAPFEEDPDTPIDLGLETEAGEVAFEGGPGLEGVRVVIDSAGGLASPNVQVQPDRGEGYTLSQSVGVSQVFDIAIPRPEAMRSATITLPYDESLLNGFPEDQLHIATLDEESGFWRPVDSPAVVDTDANTVTVTTNDFSLFAVVTNVILDAGTNFVWNVLATQAFFGDRPVVCTDGEGGNSVDVVFAIDSSGSMLTNDPGFLRLDAARTFLDAMNDRDRAGVVTFGDPAIVLLPLTDLTTGRGTVQSTIDGNTELRGATDIDGAMELANNLLATSSSDRQVKVVVLLSDGQNTGVLDDSFIGVAANRGTTVYTVGLGATADVALLTRIANGTGGRFINATMAEELSAIYEDLVTEIIDDGTDSDGDGLTDCEEVNGLFSPRPSFNWRTEETFLTDDAIYSFTEPDDPDTDGDLSDDGEEVIRRLFADNPDVAADFPELIQQGRTTYFELITGRPDEPDTDFDNLPDPVFPETREFCLRNPDNRPSPFEYDSDADGVSDEIECANGSNPLVDEIDSAYGVPGFRASILVAPALYDRFGFANPPVATTWQNVDGSVTFIDMEPGNTVFYDEDYNCVTNCASIVSYAQDRPNDNGWRWCNRFNPSACVDDESQIRDKIREIVEKQGAFDDDGHYRADLIANEAASYCRVLYGREVQCQFDEMRDVAQAQLALVAVGSGSVADVSSRTLSERLKQEERNGRSVRINDRVRERIERVAQASRDLSRVYREAQQTDTSKEEQIRQSIETCYQSNILDVLSMINRTVHPCDVYPVFVPSVLDVDQAARLDAEHIAGRPFDMVLNYQPGTQAQNRIRADLVSRGLNIGEPRRWYVQFDGCLPGQVGIGQECDEYPYCASFQSGPGPLPPGEQAPSTASPRGSIRAIPANQNMCDGVAYGSFTRTCPTVRASQPFIVAPDLAPIGPTRYKCPAN